MRAAYRPAEVATELLTLSEVAQRLRISQRSVQRLVNAGRLRVVNPIPGRTLITSRELEAYIASLIGRVA